MTGDESVPRRLKDENDEVEPERTGAAAAGPETAGTEAIEGDVEPRPEATASGEGSSDYTDEVTKIAAERDEYLDALRRLQAEFDNYRKRVMRLQTEVLERATTSLLERLLPVLDAFDLALAHAREDRGEPEPSVVEVLTPIRSLLTDISSKEGLERIDEVGVPFDPTVHHAVAHEESDGDEEPEHKGGVVTEVLRAGYRLKGQVIRPAMVRVRG